MYPAPIREYYCPATLAEASRHYSEAEGEAVFIAGGMSLMQALKSRLITPDCIIDLNHIEDLKGISIVDNTITIGAMCRYRDIANSRDTLNTYEAICDAAAHVGDRQVRNRGTIGGSLCWNYIAACSPVAALAIDAELSVMRANYGKVETIKIDDFLKGPMETALEEGDLLLSVKLPVNETAAGSAYKKWGVVTDALPVIGVGVYIELSSTKKCKKARFAVGGLQNGPARAYQAEQLLVESDISQAESLKQAATKAAEEIETADDPWISADYRSYLIERLGTEMLETSLSSAKARLS
jgi:carbon-monoxide dehydrogenase medium subunit